MTLPIAEALDLGILALNTLAAPEATDPPGYAELDEHADGAAQVLAALRDHLAAVTTDEVRDAFTRADDGWTHPDHLAGITVTTFYGECDGVPVVQVDSGTAPRVRINLNDAPVWDGLPEHDERPGRYAHTRLP